MWNSYEWPNPLTATLPYIPRKQPLPFTKATTVTVYFTSKALPLFAFAGRWVVGAYYYAHDCTSLTSSKHSYVSGQWLYNKWQPDQLWQTVHLTRIILTGAEYTGQTQLTPTGHYHSTSHSQHRNWGKFCDFYELFPNFFSGKQLLPKRYTPLKALPSGIFLYKPLTPKGCFQSEIIINVSVSSSRFIWIPMFWVYGH